MSLDDGEFEVTLIKTPKNAIELSELLGALGLRQINEERMYSFRSGSIRFESLEEIPWTLDGEFGGVHDEVTITNAKQGASDHGEERSPGKTPEKGSEKR